MMNKIKNKMKTQVLVIGGGPAGSTVATMLAKNGIDCFVVEKDIFPRFKVGESLLPSALQIFDYLGVRGKIESHGFVKKRGAYLRWGKHPEPWAITFGELVNEDGYSYHVIRSEFDKILLDHTKECGAKVWEGARLENLEFELGRPKYAQIIKDGIKHQVEFDYVVDCSGQAGVIANRYLNSRVQHKSFQNVALWSYWENAGKLPSPYEGAVLTSAIDNGWIWGIPLHDGSQSIGVVLHKDHFKKLSSKMRPNEIYEHYIGKCDIASKLISSSTGRRELKVIQDYSYTSKAFAGEGFFLCGDSACFLDPVLSSGVHLAMYSGLMAAASISSILKGQVSEKEAVTFFDSIYRRSYTRFAQFLSSFYNQNERPSDYFWKAQQLTNSDFSSGEMKKAFLGLISGIEDIQEISMHESISAKLSDQVQENLQMRKEGLSVDTDSTKEVDKIVANNNIFQNIEGISGLNQNDAVQGLYAKVSPELGLYRTQMNRAVNGKEAVNA